MITERFRSWRIKQRAKTEEAMRLAADEMVAELKRTLSVPYPPSGRPGQPPHSRSGELVEGIKRTGVSRTTVGAQINITSSRASRGNIVPRALEFGTPKMAARPYMGPMRMRWKKRFLKFIADYLKK